MFMLVTAVRVIRLRSLIIFIRDSSEIRADRFIMIMRYIRRVTVAR
jgi:hypothetical protein